MADKEFPSIYPHSFAQAKQLGELNDWKASHKENTACKNAIEEAIRRDFDGMHLKGGCAENVINQFGYHRVSYILANSLQCRDYDGRFSRGNYDWAKQTYIQPDKDSYSNRNLDFAVDSHSAVLDGFVSQYRRAYQALGLFDHTNCLPDTEKQDFEGKVIVLSPKTLKESCLTVQDQLWLCTGGFGAHAGANGRAVFAVNLADGEKTRWNRTDFTGVLAESNLPDWAKEKLSEIQEQKQVPSAMGGMTMQ